jgi:serine/threonine protein kinase
MREAKIYAELPECDYIVKYIDCFFDDSNHFYLVLDYCNGGSLDILIKKNKIANTKFDINQLIQWSKEMIFGVEFLHSQNIIHRDIKPA